MRRAVVYVFLIAAGITAGALTAPSVFAAAATVRITSVRVDGTDRDPRFVVNGSGFGAKPQAKGPPSSSASCRGQQALGNNGQNFGSRLFFIDLANKFSGGLCGPYGGYSNVVDCVGLIVSSYTSTRVVFTLGGDYQKHPYTVGNGDRVTFHVAGATATIAVRYGKTVTA